MNDRRHADEQIGYLTGTVEAIDEKLDGHMEDEKLDKKRINDRMDCMEGKIDQLLVKHNSIKVVWATIKVFGTILFLLFAGYKGDIKLAWDVFLKGL